MRRGNTTGREAEHNVAKEAEIRALVEELRRSGFRELAGTRVEGDFAIRESLVNRAVATMLADARGPIRSAVVTIEAGDRFHVKLTLAQRFIPPLGIEATIERQPELPALPVVVLRWRSLPGLAALAGPALAFLNVLPPGVRVEGDRVSIDVRLWLARVGLADLLPLLSDVRISTRERTMELRVVSGVPEE